MYKSLLFAFFLLFQTSIFSQGLFKGDKSELDLVTKLGKIPSITVLDKTGKKFQLEKYLEANKRHKDKPFLLVIWGIGEPNGVKSLAELSKNNTADQYNIVSLFIDSKLENADRMNQSVEKASTEKSWDKFLLLSTDFDELEKSFYIKEYPKHIYAAGNLDVITVCYVQPYTGAEAMLSNIQAGLKKGEGIWLTEEGTFSKKDDAKAKFYNQYKVDGDKIFFTSNSKSKSLQTITYLKKGEEYLYNGELLTQTETGQKTGTGRFKEGVPVESYNTWYADGKKLFEYPVNGTAKGYDKMGKISFEGQIVNGLGNGISTYYENEKKTSVYNYKAGVLSGIQKKFWGNGEVTEWFESPDYESGWYIKDGLQRIKKNDKWGFADRTGKIIIPIKYNSVNDFSEGRARLKLNGLYGFVDNTGAIIIPIKYSNAGDFSEGKASVELNDLYGYLDKTGKVVIPFKYSYADEFKDGVASVILDGESFNIDNRGIRQKDEDEEEKQYDQMFFSKDGLRKVKLNNKYGFIDEDGNEITEIEYDDAGDFYEGMAAVKKDGKMGFINKVGKIVIPLMYDYAEYFSEGLAYVVTATDKYSNSVFFIDKTNTKVISLKSYSDYARQFHEGLLAVKNNDGWGYLDKSGKIAIKNQYSAIAKNFDNGYATVGIWNGGMGAYYGIIDKNGTEILPVKYSEIRDGFEDGIFCIQYINKDSVKFKYGAMDKSGKIIIPFIYDDTRHIGNGLIMIRKNGKYGAVNYSNKIVIPVNYDFVGHFSEGLFHIQINKKWGYINSNGDIIISPKYDRAWGFENGEAWVEYEGKHFYINKKGEKVD
ncbi:MAG: WG repeat-containing protein [Chitinophagaceae bacterium]